MTQHAHVPAERIAWVDYAKGLCIVMVVMMHSTLGVGAAAAGEGFLHAVVAFAKPFRMPDFFLISGLFLALVIDRDWKTYLDRKVVHFAYFYILWMAIQFGLKAPGLVAEQGGAATLKLFALSLIEPFGTLWFIYLLPVFFVVTKLLRRVPPAAVWVAAAALEIAPVATGWTVIDEFAARYVYFFTGTWLATHIFALARGVQDKPGPAIAGLAAWALLNGLLVWSGHAELPGVGLALGLLGAAAIVGVAALLALARFPDALRYCGEHSLVIYLAFFVFMAGSRVALLKTGLVTDIGLVSLAVTAAGVIGPLLLYWTVRGTPLRFLFARPERFWLVPRRRLVLQPAE